MLFRVWLIGLLLAAAALGTTVVTGCGGGNSSDAAAEGSSGPAIPTSAPEVTVPEGLPPKKLVVKDLRKGSGVEAQKGDGIKVQYNGVIWSSGTEHADSWHYEHVPYFELGSHRLLRGLNLAIPGMKEGGSREVIIPYNLSFYPGEPHPPLHRLDALIYKVYLVKVFKNP